MMVKGRITLGIRYFDCQLIVVDERVDVQK